jgi:hypothetical protein
MFGYTVLFAFPTMKRGHTSNWDRAVAEGTIAAASPPETSATANHLNTFDLPDCLTPAGIVATEIVRAAGST